MRALAVISSRVGSHDQANIVSGEAMASILFEFLMCQLQNMISLCYHFGTYIYEQFGDWQYWPNCVVL